MTTYFVRMTGSDSNNGLTAAAAFLTLGKAATIVAAGDTVWVGAGVYRETLTISTSGTNGSPVTWTADVDGAQTGDAGEVRLNPVTPNDFTNVAPNTIVGGAKAYQTFNKFYFVVGATAGWIGASGASTTNWIFNDCAMAAVKNVSAIAFTVTVDQSLNWQFNRCLFFYANTPVALTVPTTNNADYDVDVVFQGCVAFSQIAMASLTGSGANAGKGYGIKIYNCTAFGRLLTAGAGHSTVNPSLCYNSVSLSGATVPLSANAAGMITEDYNCFVGVLTNVTQGVHSSALGVYGPGFHFGQEAIWGGALRPFMSPTLDSTYLSFGAQAGGLAVDVLNRNRPSGVSRVATGTATSGGNKTLTDTGQAWGTNAWAGFTVQLTGGTGSGQTKQIASNTGTVLTVDGNWKTNPDSTSTYQIYWGDPSSTGKATSGTTTTLTDSNAGWGGSQWVGYTVSIDGGTGSGQTAVISSNTTTALTFPALGTAPDSTSTYSIYKATGVTTQDYAAGAYERHEIGQKETAITDAGSVGIRIMGAGSHEFHIPVNAASTVVTVRVQYDTAHGTGSKPQAQLLANGEIGYTGETVTATGGAGAFETLTFAAFTPTAKGFVTLRLISRAAVSNGIAYFDTVTVT